MQFLTLTGVPVARPRCGAFVLRTINSRDYDGRMCNGSWIARKLTTWHPFSAAAQTGKYGFEAVPPSPGIYSLRVRMVGTANMRAVQQQYIESEFYRALLAADAASEKFFAGLEFGDGWGYRNESYATDRLARLDRVKVVKGKLACPVIYIGASNNLRRRMIELAHVGHTINHPLWALLHAGWKIDVGVRETDHGEERPEEQRMMQQYAQAHDDQLPALVER